MQGFRQLDDLLRSAGAGVPVRRPEAGETVGPLCRVNLMLAAGYGVCMGVYGLLRPDNPEYRQLFASAVKVPLLFGLTLAVTFPSLYVFATLLGSRLRFGDLLRLVVGGLGVLVAVLAAFGPIVAFFSVSTTSYPFVLLLNVGVFALSGLFGAGFLYRMLSHRPAESERDGEPAGVGPTRVFTTWMIVFGLVGGQMGWVLRPFVGHPHLPFAWFRPREGSFFEGVAGSVRMLLVGE
ncbi:MAG: hypothetical protein ACRC7O_16295 [Fimbriiglobus sp.]